jgi:hypothetical protein
MKLALLAAAPIALFIALTSSCGAVTLEPQPPEEPVSKAPVRPRLLRPDGGPAPASSADDLVP